MIDHVSIAVSDLVASAAFYDKVLAPLSLERIVDRDRIPGCGKSHPGFWLSVGPGAAAMPQGTVHHVRRRDSSRDAIVAFDQAAVAQGGVPDGAPGVREAALTAYFGAVVRDLDGSRIEAVTLPKG